MEQSKGPHQAVAPPPYPGPSMTSSSVYQHQTIYTVEGTPQVVYQPSTGGVNLQPVTHVVMKQQLPEDIPAQMTCPFCHNAVVTETRYKSGLLTWLLCGGLAIFMLLPCAFIPFCVDACKDVQHSCPSCHNVLHTYKRI